jgi:hypothetical protein
VELDPASCPSSGSAAHASAEYAQSNAASKRQREKIELMGRFIDKLMLATYTKEEEPIFQNYTCVYTANSTL